MTGFHTYGGKRLGTLWDYIITESEIRPEACRYEAHREGEASIFANRLEDLICDIKERTRMVNMDPVQMLDGLIQDLNDGDIATAEMSILDYSTWLSDGWDPITPTEELTPEGWAHLVEWLRDIVEDV